MKILSSPVFLLAAVLIGFSPAEKININSAELEDLIKIIHIGETRAKELIFLRPFSSLDDLDRIKGIGASRIEDIKKQGLAWVDATENSSPPTEKTHDVSLSELAAVSESVRLFPFLMASAIAVFSGMIIFFLKRKTN